MACHDACFYVTLISPDSAVNKDVLLILYIISIAQVTVSICRVWAPSLSEPRCK